ncbi:syndetin isoform X1 [Tachysurus ichikawai]
MYDLDVSVLMMHITSDSYIPCLTDLCKALWEVMLSYYRTMQWHEEHDKEEVKDADTDHLAQKDEQSSNKVLK